MKIQIILVFTSYLLTFTLAHQQQHTLQTVITSNISQKQHLMTDQQSDQHCLNQICPLNKPCCKCCEHLTIRIPSSLLTQHELKPSKNIELPSYQKKHQHHCQTKLHGSHNVHSPHKKPRRPVVFGF